MLEYNPASLQLKIIISIECIFMNIARKFYHCYALIGHISVLKFDIFFMCFSNAFLGLVPSWAQSFF